MGCPKPILAAPQEWTEERSGCVSQLNHSIEHVSKRNGRETLEEPTRQALRNRDVTAVYQRRKRSAAGNEREHATCALSLPGALQQWQLPGTKAAYIVPLHSQFSSTGNLTVPSIQLLLSDLPSRGRSQHAPPGMRACCQATRTLNGMSSNAARANKHGLEYVHARQAHAAACTMALSV